MGGGYHGGFGNTLGSIENREVRLPKRDSQLMHIFRKSGGHLIDTPENRRIILELANDPERFVGIDDYGNRWHSRITEEGHQYWVRHRYGIINEGGLNLVPRPWNPHTGYNRASRMVKDAVMKNRMLNE